VSTVDQDQREHLLSDLESADEEVRRLAVERLTTLPASEAIPALVRQLADPSWRVRKASIERLSAAPETSGAIPALVLALADGDNPGRRNAALEALTRCGSSAVPVLLEASHDADVDVRKQVVDALAGIGDDSSAERLLELLTDPDANVRGAAAEALGCTRSESLCVPLLRAVQEDEETLVRLSALRALDRLEAQVPAAALMTVLDDGLLCAAAYSLLGHSDEPDAVDVLLKGVESGGRSARDAAVQALVRSCARTGSASDALAAQVRRGIGPDGAAFAYAIERAQEGALAARLAVVQLLGLLAHPEAVVPLLQAATDEALTEVALTSLAAIGPSAAEPVGAAWPELGVEARCIACRMLASMEGPASRAILTEALRGEHLEVRAQAARALGAHGAVEAVPDLVDLMALVSATGEEWREEEERSASAEALAAIGARAPGAVVSALVERLGAEGDGFRLAGARILKQVGRPEDEASLALLTSDPSPAVRRAAVEGLAAVAATPPLDSLRLSLADEDPGVRIGAAHALAVSHDVSVISDLAHLMEDPDERVRAAGLRSLGRWSKGAGDAGLDARERVLALVSQALQEGGNPAMAGLEVLEQLGGPAAVALAGSVLNSDDPELVEAAVGCIGRHAERDALCDLLPLLAHDSWAVRAQAVDVLAERRVPAAVPALLRRLESERDDFVRDALLSALDRLE
jgi:HEAT repeat protein